MASTNLIPNWFNLELFQKILDNYIKDGKVTNFNVSPAANAGDHIGGNVLRANITYHNLKNDSQDLSMIIKYFNELSDPSKIDKKYQIELKTFVTEYKMYTEVIPKFEKMLKTAGDKTLLGPRLYYASENPYKIIVLEDLKKSGYYDFPNKMADDKLAETAIDKLAKWHACSYKINEDSEGYFKDWNNSVFKTNEDNPGIMSGGPKSLIKVLKPIAEKCTRLQEIIGKLEKIESKIYKKCSNIYEYSKTQTRLNVLNHGDFHIKNLMFKYFDDNQTVQDAQIIDFALCIWGSMVLDLTYVLYSIYDGRLRNEKRDEIIYTYFKKFESCLKSIGCKPEKIPKFQDLLYDFNNLGDLDLWMSTTFLPLSYGVTQQNSIVEKFVNEEDTRLSMYKVPDYLNDIKIVLKRSLVYGFLDETYYE